jgi:tetratricopeptide (TPR) repeat protein
MTKLTEDSIREIFGDKTFFKGQDYYDNGHVLGAVKLENTLYAQVLGSASVPYEVRAYIDPNINTECTCPVGNMCKHGVALLLQWTNDSSSFISADEFIGSLEKMNKDEIINILKSWIKQNPSLINEFSLETGEKPEVNIDAVSDKIEWIVRGELDYYHVWDAIRRLGEIKRSADRLVEKGSYKGAAEIYLALVKGGVTAYEEGADDSDGGIGDFVSGCIEDFNECVAGITDSTYKDKLLEKILGIIEGEDYGLEISEMLCGAVTIENIGRMESYLMEKLKAARENPDGYNSYKYEKAEAFEILDKLYEKIGKPEEMLRLAQHELVDREDYARLADVLAQNGRFEEAFDTVKKGFAQPGDINSGLNELYFALAKVLVDRKSAIIDFKTSLEVAIDMMSHHFDKEEYERAKEVFRSIGKLEEFRDALRKSLSNRDTAVQALLHDGELKVAIDTVLAEQISTRTMLMVSKAAKDKGMTEESGKLTRMMLERGWSDARQPVGELVDAMVDVSDMSALRDLSGKILKMNDARTALLLIPYLTKKAPELAVALAKKFVDEMPVGLVAQVAQAAAGKAPEDGIALCRMRINEDVLRSHVHYDKAVLLLATIRDIYAAKGNKAKWLEFIRGFAAENKGKKKLMERVKREFGVYLA